MLGALKILPTVAGQTLGVSGSVNKQIAAGRQGKPHKRSQNASPRPSAWESQKPANVALRVTSEGTDLRAHDGRRCPRGLGADCGVIVVGNPAEKAGTCSHPCRLPKSMSSPNAAANLAAHEHRDQYYHHLSSAIFI